MITKEARAEAQSRGAHKVLAFYGLDKSAAAAGGILNTLGAAGSRALTSGTKAYTHGGGNMAQNAWRGIQGAAKGFHRGGGTGAAAKAVGVGAAGLGATYAAGRGFGAGMRDAQANNAPTGGVKLNGLREDLIGGEFQAGEDIPGFANSTAIGLLGAEVGHALQGAYRGASHGHALRGAGRGWVGSVGGGVLGAGLGAALSNLSAALSNKPIGGAALAGRLLGSGLGAHLLTRKYLADRKKPAPPASPELDEIRLTDPIDLSGAPGTKISGIREELIGGKLDPWVDLPGLATNYLATHVSDRSPVAGAPLVGAVRGGLSEHGSALGGALRGAIGGTAGGILGNGAARLLGAPRYSLGTDMATRLGVAGGAHLMTRKYLTEPYVARPDLYSDDEE